MPSAPLPSGLCRLADRGVIRAVGADAAAFLQGQLTNDVAGLGADDVRLAGFCSAKGRLQASFVVWRSSADEFLLVCAADLLAATLKRLSMFVLRAKCKLSDASAEVGLWGLAGASAAAVAPTLGVWTHRRHGETTVVRLPDAGGSCRLLVAASGADAPVFEGVGALAPSDWNGLDVQSGIVTIEAATVDRFVPQMVNFELVGGVDFRKGCYPGQEVVARSQYRGTTKRRTFLFESDSPAMAGQDVFLAGGAGEPVGTVANAASRPGGAGSVALVEVRLAALGDGELRLGSADGPALRRVDLPYPVPVEAEAAA